MTSINILSIVTLIILIALLIYYIGKNKESFSTLTIANPSLLVILIILFVFSYFLIAILNNELMKALGLKMIIGESFALSIITGFYNLITPFRGGMAARAVYLKKKYDFAYVNFLATLSAIYVLIFLVASILGLVSAWSIYSMTGLISLPIVVLLGAIFLFFSMVILISPNIPEQKNRWLNRFIKVINGWNLIKKTKELF